MKKQVSIFNPYSLLILAVFVEYFPSFYQAPKPSIRLGPVDFYIIDIAVIFLLGYAFFGLLGGQPSSSLKKKNMGGGIRIIFALFFAYSCFKWLLQSNHDTGSIRMMLSYAPAYLFLFFFPMHITRKEDLRKLLFLLILFLVYIFLLHIYAFATEGYKLHILSGQFLSMLSVLYFLAIRGNDLLKLSSKTCFFVRALVIVTYFMVGHRSGLIAILLGLFVYSFYYKNSVFKEILVLMMVILVGAGVTLIVSPKTLSGVEQRASTTFDSSQGTYVGRFYNIFIVLKLSEDNPLIGKPLVTNETVEMKRMKVTRGGVTSAVEELVVTPHNLILEWLLYYGWIGVLLGLSLIIAAIRHVKRFLRENKSNIRCRQLGVVMLCTMTHNLFFSLTNVTTNNVFSTFFLYFPLAILIAMSRYEESYCK
jgi:hypothetical protein